MRALFSALRDIEIRYDQSCRGVLWIVVQTVLIMVVFSTLFGIFAKGPSEGLPHPTFHSRALLPWQFVANVLEPQV